MGGGGGGGETGERGKERVSLLSLLFVFVNHDVLCITKRCCHFKERGTKKGERVWFVLIALSLSLSLSFVPGFFKTKEEEKIKKRART